MNLGRPAATSRAHLRSTFSCTSRSRAACAPSDTSGCIVAPKLGVRRTGSRPHAGPAGRPFDWRARDHRALGASRMPANLPVPPALFFTVLLPTLTLHGKNQKLIVALVRAVPMYRFWGLSDQTCRAGQRDAGGNCVDHFHCSYGAHLFRRCWSWDPEQRPPWPVGEGEFRLTKTQRACIRAYKAIATRKPMGVQKANGSAR